MKLCLIFRFFKPRSNVFPLRNHLIHTPPGIRFKNGQLRPRFSNFKTPEKYFLLRFHPTNLFNQSTIRWSKRKTLYCYTLCFKMRFEVKPSSFFCPSLFFFLFASLSTDHHNPIKFITPLY